MPRRVIPPGGFDARWQPALTLMEQSPTGPSDRLGTAGVGGFTNSGEKGSKNLDRSRLEAGIERGLSITRLRRDLSSRSRRIWRHTKHNSRRIRLAPCHAPRSEYCKIRRWAPEHGSHTRSYRRFASDRRKEFETTCRSHFHKHRSVPSVTPYLPGRMPGIPPYRAIATRSGISGTPQDDRVVTAT